MLIFCFFDFDVVTGGGFDGGFELVSKRVTVGGCDDDFAKQASVASDDQFSVFEAEGAHPKFCPESAPL